MTSSFTSSVSAPRRRLILVPLAAALALGCQRPASAQSPPAATSATSTPAPTLVTAVDVSGLVAKVKGAVVNITVEPSKGEAAARGDARSPFDFFFGPNVPSPRGGKQRALGTGFLFDDKGHVLTNAHVVEGADVVRVRLADERELAAKVKGRDERLDIAVLELEGATNLPYVTLGSSDALRVGESVVAIGNPFGLGHTVTMGIVSAKGRAIGAGPYDDFIQTDASINPGNSGGPLFDVRGQVVGINTAINPNGQGIGFAIPADDVKRILEPLVAQGHVRRGQLGIHIQDVDERIAKALGLASTKGALVGHVVEGSAGAKAGLRQGDVILGVDGGEIVHSRDLPRVVGRHAPGSKLTLDVARGTQKVSLAVVLDELEEPRTAKNDGAPEASPSAASIGVDVTDATGGGALVGRVAPGGPAAGALHPGDVVLEVNRKRVGSAAELAATVRATPAGRPVLLLVKRDGSTRYVALERG